MWKKFILSSLIVLAVFQMCIAEEKEEFLDENFPNGLNLYMPEKCWKGYTMVPYEERLIVIIDMKGIVVHRWEIGTERARLLENGHVVVMQGSRIVEYDWDGKAVWDFEVPGGPYPETGYPSPGFFPVSSDVLSKSIQLIGNNFIISDKGR